MFGRYLPCGCHAIGPYGEPPAVVICDVHQHLVDIITENLSHDWPTLAHDC